MSDTVLRPKPLVFRALGVIPLIGSLLRDAGKSDEALIFALLNAAMLWVMAGFIWGIAGVLAVALCLVPIVLGTVITMMLSGGKIG